MKLDPPRLLVIARTDQLGLDLANLSRAIGRNAAYLQQYIRRGIPRVLPEDVREALAKELGVASSALRGAIPGKGAPRAVSPEAVATDDTEAEVLSLFRQLSTAGRLQAVTILKALVA